MFFPMIYLAPLISFFICPSCNLDLFVAIELPRLSCCSLIHWIYSEVCYSFEIKFEFGLVIVLNGYFFFVFISYFMISLKCKQSFSYLSRIVLHLDHIFVCHICLFFLVIFLFIMMLSNLTSPYSNYSLAGLYTYSMTLLPTTSSNRLASWAPALPSQQRWNVGSSIASFWKSSHLDHQGTLHWVHPNSYLQPYFLCQSSFLCLPPSTCRSDWIFEACI